MFLVSDTITKTQEQDHLKVVGNCLLFEYKKFEKVAKNEKSYFYKKLAFQSLTSHSITCVMTTEKSVSAFRSQSDQCWIAPH